MSKIITKFAKWILTESTSCHGSETGSESCHGSESYGDDCHGETQGCH